MIEKGESSAAGDFVVWWMRAISIPFRLNIRIEFCHFYPPQQEYIDKAVEPADSFDGNWVECGVLKNIRNTRLSPYLYCPTRERTMCGQAS